MEYGTPEYRDAVRDVLAMLEQALEIQGLKPDSGMDPRENLAVLIEHAPSDNCLAVAVSMLASSWALVCEVRSQMRGTTRDQEIEEIFASFRALVT